MPTGLTTQADRAAEGAGRLRWLPAWLAVAVALAASLVLVGWVWDVEALRGLGLPGGTMKPNTAMALLAAGLSLWWARREGGELSRRRLARGAAAVTALVGGVTAFEYLMNRDTGFSSLLLDGAPRMSLSSAMGLLCLGLALLGLDKTTAEGRRPMHSFALVTALISGLALLGHIYGVKTLHTVWADGRLSVLAGLCLFALALGVLCARHGPGAMQLLTREGPGGAVARGLLPIVLGLPLCLDWVRVAAEQRLGLEPALGLALKTTATVILLVFFVWRAAGWGEVAEAQRAALADRLRESERRARETVESLPQLVWTCRPEGPCEYLSPQWVRYTGVPEREQLGFGWIEQVHPEDREKTIARWKETAGRGEPCDMEFRIRRHDGVYRWFKTRAEALRAPDGTIQRWFGTNTDIDEQRQAEDALRKARDELESRVKERTAELEASLVRVRLAVQAAKVGVWEWAVGADVLQWDDGMRLIYGRDEEVRVEAWREMVCVEDREETNRAMERALNGEPIFDHFFRIRRPDGSLRHIQGSALVLRAVDGRPQHIIGVNRDITDEREAEQALRRHQLELERSNRDLEQFAYVASHDLQEPLRAVSGCVQLLQRRHGDKLTPEANELIGMAVDGAKRMQGLILDLLTYSRVGTMALGRKPVELAEALAEALQNLRAALAETGGVVTHDQRLPRVSADRGRLVMLLQNLVGNALKYAAPGRVPQVHIGVERGADGVLVVSVRDNGIGIEERFFERIFVIFQRLHTRAESTGSGIGLALCKKIVERHGGRIWVESKPGVGSTFRFTLPENPPAS